MLYRNTKRMILDNYERKTSRIASYVSGDITNKNHLQFIQLYFTQYNFI